MLKGNKVVLRPVKRTDIPNFLSLVQRYRSESIYGTESAFDRNGRRKMDRRVNR